MASDAELFNALEDHVNRVRLMESKLEALKGLKGGRDVQSLYKGIEDEIARKIKMFNGGMDVLLCLTDECTALLRGSQGIHPTVSEAREEEGSRRCIACGKLNAREANFCTFCATKLPAPGGRVEGNELPLTSWRERGKMPGQKRPNGHPHAPRYRSVRLMI